MPEPGGPSFELRTARRHALDLVAGLAALADRDAPGGDPGADAEHVRRLAARIRRAAAACETWADAVDDHADRLDDGADR